MLALFGIAFYHIFCMSLGVAIFSAIPIYLYRLCARLLLPQLWARTYFRQAINCSAVMLVLLIFISFTRGENRSSQLPEAIRTTMDKLAQSKLEPFEVRQQLDIACEHLSDLSSLQNVLDQFFFVVVLPSFVIGLLGYFIELKKANAIQPPKLETKSKDATITLHDNCDTHLHDKRSI